jgi:hypothetical protein
MKKKITILILFTIVAICGCNNDLTPEPGPACFTPASGFPFEIVDKTTGANLFTNGTYQFNQLLITDLATNKRIPYTFESVHGLFITDGIGWKTEKINYSITIQEKPIFDLYIDATRINGTCSYTKINEILIKNAEFEIDKDSSVYRILVP